MSNDRWPVHLLRSEEDALLTGVCSGEFSKLMTTLRECCDPHIIAVGMALIFAAHLSRCRHEHGMTEETFRAILAYIGTVEAT